jgi:NAD(P)H dehydrogenase (quinone)
MPVSIVVTGATGHLGRLVVESLIERGVPAGQIVAAGRNTDKIADLAERGVQVRHLDFDAPETLAPAFAGADKLLLVSASEIGKRVPQHRNAVDAAKAAGVGLIVYTSAPKADTTPMRLADEHRATEELIRASGVPFVFLRNCWYLEIYTQQIPTNLQHGAVIGSAGDGKVSGASRADFAEAAAAVLTADAAEHAGKVYELGGDEAFTMSDLAEEITRQSGTKVVYQNLPLEDYQKALEGFGIPTEVAAVLADVDRNIPGGALYVPTGHLRTLIGRPATTLSAAVTRAL